MGSHLPEQVALRRHAFLLGPAAVGSHVGPIRWLPDGRGPEEVQEMLPGANAPRRLPCAFRGSLVSGDGDCGSADSRRLSVTYLSMLRHVLLYITAAMMFVYLSQPNST